ncbi:MAG: sulfite exporter TauE/SafE [Belnapia sp.]|nr:sulfite exporter TauE/SafE [Belnapia sp.]
MGGWVPAPRPVPRRLALPGALLAGAVGGITGGPAAFPAALVVIWCGLLGWPKIRQRAVFQPYILVMQVATLGLIRLLG